jgi:HSP20 family molecular chaperone IbpA
MNHVFDVIFNDTLYNKLMLEQSTQKDMTCQSNKRRFDYELVKKENKYVFTSLAAGLKQEDIKMSVSNKYLIISSTPDSSKENYFKTSLNHKVFIGEIINKEKIKASLEMGILKIILPLSEDKKDFKINF